MKSILLLYIQVTLQFLKEKQDIWYYLVLVFYGLYRNVKRELELMKCEERIGGNAWLEELLG